ncbi:MAG: tRNA pseudouridine(55) synthase TruB [Armatimonadetes bacterium]|nr:tRNA pseudouridine(55) synthase TruB [Armatimonadota bacterium]
MTGPVASAAATTSGPAEPLPESTARAARDPIGIAVVEKPGGITSHDVVNRVRRFFGCRRVGHAGTLDPMATGVLVLCVGQATRIVEYLPTEPKVYEAAVVFGIETDSLDVTGSETRTENASWLTAREVEAILPKFRGDIVQTPPMVSAVHVGGQRLYELARRGREVERVARPVTIHSLEMRGFEPGAHPVARLVVECSAGTYVRSLAADIGTAIGCGAALAELRRTRVGRFRIEDACPVEGPIELMPIESALDTWPIMDVDFGTFANIRAGRQISSSPPPCPIGPISPITPTPTAKVLIRHGSDEYAVAERVGDLLQPVKVLAHAEAAP